jgi:hypothetical protein
LASDEARPSAPLSTSLPRSAAASEPSDAELERGILDAVRLGLADVARTLSGQLDERRRLRGGKVVDLATRRGR